MLRTSFGLYGEKDPRAGLDLASQAETQFEQIGMADPAIDLFSPTQQGRLAGSCYLFLDNPKRAQPILERTAEALRDRSNSRELRPWRHVAAVQDVYDRLLALMAAA